ncbi:LuxR C-terminal-related transcriptional regulator [Carboxylicivirga sp. M1479]|uniref:LuxR C-terminal-related transcriptional regulator n=1 Tax=Carboxylicivirga sp. M1479 TaxID=2594476 RepID=UPI0011784B27|nr:LuxR C-terminal-related transcriptional regulator [Carboxylicivirga sp. M1479]TRX63322.1 hypothetical protein FNN09_18905 [Carboxylicivirga sp. M1479]
MQETNKLDISKAQIPSLPSFYLSRPELLKKISGIDPHKLLIFEAPSGYAKTSLLAEWAAENSSTVCWLNAEETDANLHAFIRYMIAAIRKQVPSFCNNIQFHQKESNTSIVIDVTNELYALPLPLTLVIDDFHLILNTVLIDFILHLHKGAAKTLQLILLSDKPISDKFENLALKNLVYTFDVKLLKFNNQEIRQLLKEQKPALKNHVRELCSITYGWPNAIINILNNETNEDSNVWKSIDLYYDRYLNFCLKQCSPSTKALIQLFSHLGWVNNDAFDQLLPYCEALVKIDYLTFTNEIINCGLVERIDDTNTIQLHQPLINYVRSKELKMLHNNHFTSKVASILISTGENKRAFEYYIYAGQQQDDLFDRLRIEALNQGNFRYLIKVLSLLDKRANQNGCLQLLTQTWINYHFGQIHAFDKNVLKLEKCIPLLSSNSLDLNNLRGELNTLKAIRSYYFKLNTEESIRSSQEASTLISHSNTFVAGMNWLYYAIALQYNGKASKACELLTLKINNEVKSEAQINLFIALCYVHWLEANLIELSVAARTLLKLSNENKNSQSLVIAKHFLGIVFLYSNRQDKAKEVFYELLEIETSESSFYQFYALTSLLFIGFEDTDDDSVTQQLLNIHELAYHRDNQIYKDYSEAVTHLALWRHKNELSSLNWAENNEARLDFPSIYTISVPHTQASILISSNYPQLIKKGIHLLQNINTLSNFKHNTYHRVEAFVLEALGQYKLEHYKSALLILNKAVKIAQGKKLHLPFVKYKDELQSLFASFDQDAISNAFIHQFSENEPPNKKIDYTKREIEVMEQLLTKVSNKEIGEKLFISDKTVKRHIANIYKKLGASNRSEAISLARLYFAKK